MGGYKETLFWCVAVSAIMVAVVLLFAPTPVNTRKMLCLQDGVVTMTFEDIVDVVAKGRSLHVKMTGGDTLIFTPQLREYCFLGRDRVLNTGVK